MNRVHSPDGLIPTPNEVEGVSNARMIAELQALTLGIHLVGLDKLPAVMTRTPPAMTCIEHQAGRPTQRLSFQIKVF